MGAGKSFDMKQFRKFGDYQDKIWNMLALVCKFLGKYSEIWRLTSRVQDSQCRWVNCAGPWMAECAQWTRRWRFWQCCRVDSADYQCSSV